MVHETTVNYDVKFICASSDRGDLASLKEFDISSDTFPMLYRVDDLGTTASKCLIKYSLKKEEKQEGNGRVPVTGKFAMIYPTYVDYFDI